jgi:hypothetical protein
MVCDGCQQSFCGKHVIEHRQNLAKQLDVIMQEHDLLQQELGQSSIDNSLLKQINKWEKESITKIQVAAEAARADLVESLDRSKKQLSKACQDIAVNLRTSREADDFSENDLDRWIEQLKELKMEFTSLPSIKLIEDEHGAIPLIAIKSNRFTEKTSAKSDKSSIPTYSVGRIVQERFSQAFGTVALEDEGFVARRVGRGWEYVSILGEQLYSHGRHMVRFLIKFDKNLHHIYFGCISSLASGKTLDHSSSFAVGWFGCNQIYQHGVRKGNYEKTRYDSSEIRSNDILHLIFDCEKRQIELFHERTNKINILSVNLDSAPFPWQLLIVLTAQDDCVRILPNI